MLQNEVLDYAIQTNLKKLETGLLMWGDIFSILLNFFV